MRPEEQAVIDAACAWFDDPTCEAWKPTETGIAWAVAALRAAPTPTPPESVRRPYCANCNNTGTVKHLSGSTDFYFERCPVCSPVRGSSCTTCNDTRLVVAEPFHDSDANSTLDGLGWTNCPDCTSAERRTP